MNQVYWTVGPYDVVLVIEAPDEQSATAFILEAGSLGNIRSTMLRAFDHKEMRDIIQRLG
jgi:uncharacterized protein with GYD domain